MSAFNLLGSDAYGQYNRELARKIGLLPAVYIAEVANILSIVAAKKKFDEADGKWTLKREYMTQQTTLTEEQQLACEDIFHRLGLITRVKKNELIVNLNGVVELIQGIREVPADLFDIAEAKPTYSKKEMILWNLKRRIVESDPEMKELFEKWVESLSAIKGKLTSEQVAGFVEGIQKYPANRDAKIAAIKEATQAGWLVAEWCFKSYSKQAVNTNSRLPEQQIFTGQLDTNQEF